MSELLADVLETALDRADEARRRYQPDTRPVEVGTVVKVGEGTAIVRGLPHARSRELLRFAGGRYGVVFNLDPGEIGVILLDESGGIDAGDEVRRTDRVLDVPVGELLLGRVVDALGRPLDEEGRIRYAERWPVERPAPEIMDRGPVETPLQTGIKVVDALFPIGRGQRELIVGDRQTGKTAVAVDTIINQRETDVLCVYCVVGKEESAIAQLVAELEEHGALKYSVVVAANGDAPPGLQFVAPYAATTIAEFFRDEGRDVLVVYDDLTWHARAYRELSLLLRRPPGREAYPGDIFYIHSRLLERSARLREEAGGGSLTALPIVETQAQNLSAYIPTNLISITDGQIYLSPTLFQKGILPAVDVGRSVSRVGGRAQLPAYRAVSGDLRLAYSQFQELESFARFSTRLDEESRRAIVRGRRVREVLKQDQFAPIPVDEQIAVLLAVTSGAFDEVHEEEIAELEARIRAEVREHHADFTEAVRAGEPIEAERRGRLIEAIDRIVEEIATEDR